MPRLLLALILLVFPVLAPAQTVPVRSGEHPGFTRLVFETPDQTSWVLGRGAEGYELQLEKEGLRIDLARVFDKIGRTRLSAVSLDAPGRIGLSVRDGVHAHAFDLRAGVLVVDIRDGSPPAGSPFELPFKTGSGKAPGPALSPLPLLLAPRQPDPFVAGLLAPRPGKIRLPALRRDLFQQVGRAASQGLVGPLAPALRDGDESVGGPGAGMADHDADPPANMTVRTSIDRGLAGAVAKKSRSGVGPACWPDAALDVAAWQGDQSPAALIAQHRGALFDGRDRTRPGAAEQLAQAYLALGFGAEAARVLEQFGSDVPEAALWRQMAAILDDGQAAEPMVFEGQLACPGAAAMWAALAWPALPPAMPRDTAAIRRGFSALPPHLRHRLGPPLAQRFLAIGDMTTARAIGDATLRGKFAPGDPRLRILEARLALDHAETAQSEETVTAIADSGAVDAAEALALSLDRRIHAETAPLAADILAAESLGFELRGTPMGDRLRGLAILGHGLHGAFPTAFANFQAAPPDDAGEIADALTARLAGHGSDADILRAVPGGPAWDVVSQARPAARVALARRFVTLGLVSQAETLIDGLPGRDDPDLRMVLAEIALFGQAPGQALQYLSGLDGSAAAALRARARAARGDFQGAAEAAMAAGDPARAIDFAWLGQDWSAIRAIGSPDQKRLADLRDLPLPPGPSLAGARSVLVQSADMREALDALLGSAPGGVRPTDVQTSSTGAP
ncbi:hypothetical protein EV663_106129 [Rhodovulum bhavnagarense]|uniref:Uncharacterized protein n=1 Tax=Rhodovulum bhavnagarense TaxID=992286 RepID=A0A4R2RN39_9RHOB|nr:hypothetical protein [Rhodovulum bhavnagarense]TCP61181.1 hypothetical protein EV663_106129 [Rhodovulum bhavnagarense]